MFYILLVQKKITAVNIQHHLSGKKCFGFIPVERIFLTTFSQSISRFINCDIPLPKWLIDFGVMFEHAKNSIKKFSIDFLDASYEYDDSKGYIKFSNGIKTKLSRASSGLQSVIPLILVIKYNTEMSKGNKNLFVVEEPELNLYPSSQKDLIEFIV